MFESSIITSIFKQMYDEQSVQIYLPGSPIRKVILTLSVAAYFNPSLPRY